MIRVAVGFVKAAWGGENFPISGTSNENEMSAIQFARIAGKTILLTGDTGREGLTEAADYAPLVGLDLPGIDRFQVPHHGGRHNVNTEVLDRWVGKRLPAQPAETHWVAICSSAKADEDHPKKVVVRAMIHRGAHFVATEGQNICTAQGITREGWSALPQTAYPDEEEE